MRCEWLVCHGSFSRRSGEVWELRKNVFKCLQQDTSGTVPEWLDRQMLQVLRAVLGRRKLKAHLQQSFTAFVCCLILPPPPGGCSPGFSLCAVQESQMKCLKSPWSGLASPFLLGNVAPAQDIQVSLSWGLSGLQQPNFFPLAFLSLLSVVLFQPEEENSGVCGRLGMKKLSCSCRNVRAPFQVACNLPNGPEILCDLIL